MTRSKDPPLSVAAAGLAAAITSVCVAVLGGCTDTDDTAPDIGAAVVAVRAVNVDTVNDLGVGVRVGRCTVVTADHVVRDAATVEVGAGIGDRWTPAVVIDGDPRVDLALLAVPTGAMPLLLTAADDAILAGSRAWMITSGDTAPRPIRIESVVTLRQRRLPSDVVAERRAVVLRGGEVGPGDSGSAVVNDAGELVGVVTLADRGDDVAYAVAPSEIAAFLTATRHATREAGGCGDDDS